MNGRHRKPRRFGLPGKLTLSLAVLATTASLATAATYASWTSSASQSPTVSSGTVTVNLGATGASTNRLNVNATGIAPGDTIKRSVDLINAGSLDLASITLTTTATASSALDTDTTNGLQFQIDVCSQAWTESGSSPAFSYVCGGSTSAVLASRAIIGNTLALSNLAATTHGVTDHLLVTITFPGGVGTTLQGLSSTVQFTFTGTQRAGSAH